MPVIARFNHSYTAPDNGIYFVKQKAVIVFSFRHENICCGYSLEAPRRGVEAPRRGASNEYHNICFYGEI